jgi:tRNA G18 (ribose-2'-O)-methylase SpoU
MNVHDHMKEMSVEDIRDTYIHNSHDAAFAMQHVSGDFNLGNVVRSANFFGFREVFYIGGSKQYDRRSTVGTHHYIPLHFIRTEEEFLSTINGKYSLVAIENNVPKYAAKTVSIYEKPFSELKLPPLFLVGEEQLGLSEYMLDNVERIVTIPARGSVRSLNVGSCASIVMAMYIQHKFN